jgi:hypothetical protein
VFYAASGNSGKLAVLDHVTTWVKRFCVKYTDTDVRKVSDTVKKCQLTVENLRWTEQENKKRETERLILTRDLNWRCVSKWYHRMSAVKKKMFPGSPAKWLQEHDLLWRKVALVLWYTQNKMPQSAIKKSPYSPKSQIVWMLW